MDRVYTHYNANKDMQQRSLLLLEESCRSKHTAKTYLFYLTKFKEYYKLKDFDSMIAIEPAQLQIMVEDYTMYRKKQVSPNTLPTEIFGIKAFFDANDIDLKWKKIQKLFPEKVKRSGRGAYSKAQIGKMLAAKHDDLRATALILFLATSGVRIGAIPDLKIRHVTAYEDCKIVTVYPDTKDEYHTFLTPEASKALDDYLKKREMDGEKLTNDSALFAVFQKDKFRSIKAADKATLQEIIRRTLIKIGLRSNVKHQPYQRYHVQIDHGFRKFFNETIKTTQGINLTYAELLMGHATTIPLDNHYAEARESLLFAEYKKVILALTMDETEVLKAQKAAAEAEINELAQKNADIKNLEKRLESVEYGVHGRSADYAKSMLKARDDDTTKLLLTIIQMWFELSATERDKRIIWKKIKEAKQSGIKLNLEEIFGGSREMSLKNLES
jgi:integrase